MNPYRPVAPRIAPVGGTVPAQSAAGEILETAFALKPAEVLLATRPTALLTVDDILPLIPLHIAALESFFATGNLAPIGPLVLLYDHPDPADFAHFHFSAGYPVDPHSAEKVAAFAEATGIEGATKGVLSRAPRVGLGNSKAVFDAPRGTDFPPLEVRTLPPFHIASVTFAGPWSELGRAYPVLRQAIENSGLAFGPLTIERYVVVGGTHDAGSVTVVQRQLQP